jgi:hypothetical protein
VSFVRAQVDNLDISVSRGQATEVPFDFVDEAPGTVSLWIGGDASDLDDTTDATEVVGVVASFIATFTIPAQTTARQDLRLERDGVMVAVGTLHAEQGGRRVATQSYTVNISAAEVTVNASGVSSSVVSGLITSAVDALPVPADGLGTYYNNANAALARFDRSSLFRYGTVAGVSGTTSPTSLLASSLTIPANTLTAFVPASPADASSCTMVANGAVTNTTGSSRTMTYIATITQSANTCTWTLPLTVPNGTSSAPWRLEIDWTLLDTSGFTAPSGSAALVANGLTDVTVTSSPGFSDFDVTAAWTVTFTATPSFSSGVLSTSCLPGLDVRFRRSLYTA